MNCRVIAINTFKRDAKQLVKKYASLKAELALLQEQLMQNPRMGIQIHENVYKIRIAVKSKGKGKSGGLRVITQVLELEVQLKEDEIANQTTIFLLSIYDKSEMENISAGLLRQLLSEISDEISAGDQG